MKITLLTLITVFCFIFSEAQNCTGTGAINFQRWNNISGSVVSILTSNSNYPNNPSSTGTRTLFEMPTTQGNNLGICMNGYICPPTTGNYMFWIASDATGELWLSTTSNTENKVRIAFNTNSTNSRQ